MVPCGREAVEIGESGDWSGYIPSQEAESRAQGLSSPLLLIQNGPAHRMVPPTVQVVFAPPLEILGNALIDTPRGATQSITLIMKTKGPSILSGA